MADGELRVSCSTLKKTNVKDLHFIHSDFLALHFADDGSLFGIFHPTGETELIASVLAKLGKIDACPSHHHIINGENKQTN